MRRRPWNRLARFARNRRGLAAVEFALILPIMLPMLYGMVELGNIYLLDRKITRAAMIGADLIAQSETISTSDLTDIMNAIDQIIHPYDPSTRKVVMTEVYYDPDDDRTEVDWSVARNATPDVAGTPYILPTNLIASGQSVIVVRFSYTYTPKLAHFVGNLSISDAAYLKPRLVLRIPKT